MPKLATTTALAIALVAAAPRARADSGGDLVVEVRAASPLRALVPGLVQLDRGERMKGWTLIGLEAAFLATALEFQLASGALHGEALGELSGGSFTVGQRFSEQSAQFARWRNGFLVAAAAVWAFSFVDAHLPPSPSARGESASMADRPLMPIASVGRRGVVAGVSVRF